MALICGIDEAGRGPVIGPLVMAGVVMDEKELYRFENIGVKDSKLLSQAKRERLFDMVKNIALRYEIIVITPKQVDESLASPALNLNKLEGLTSAKILNNLKPEKAILDAPSNNISAFEEYVKGFLETDIDLRAEHKADLNYVVVGAASILAKVTRDREIEKLKRQVGIDFGSGYPSDPKTVKFLKENFDKYDFFRKSWASYKNVVSGKNQSSLSNFK
jgi:ribonuclease HII